jgi:hypothetical protein
MWSDAQADPPACPGAGRPAAAAPELPDGFPHGRALCETCLAFVPLVDGALAAHETWRSGGDPIEDEHRRTWFNAHGW